MFTADTADAEGTAGTADVQQVHRGLEMAPAAEEEQNNNEDKVCLHSVRTLCMTACIISTTT